MGPRDSTLGALSTSLGSKALSDMFSHPTLPRYASHEPGIVWCCPHMSFLDFGILNPWVCRAETSAGRLSDDSFCCQMRTHNSVKFYVTFFLKQHRTIAHLSLVLTASNLSNWYLFLQVDIFPCVLHFNSWSLKCLPVFFPRCSFFFSNNGSGGIAYCSMRPKGISSTFVCCWTVASIIWKICHFERTTMIPSLGLAWRTPRSPPNHLGKWRRLGGRPKRLRFGADAADTGFSSFDSCSRSIVAGFQMSCGKFSPCHFDYILVLYTIQWGKTFSENLPLLLSTTQIHHLCLGQLQGEVVSQFLRENHFKHFEERDSSGWSPMCYAAMRGDVKILKALLAKKGNPNDKTTTLWSKKFE